MAPLIVNENLIVTGMETSTAEATIRALAERMFQHGYVKDSFADAVLAREVKHPTGLPTEIPVGLPHTDIVHCLKPGIALGVLKQPVAFHAMGDPEQTVNVQLVFLLSVVDPPEQVKVLTRLIDFCQQPALLQSIIDSATPASALDLLKRNLSPDEGTSAVADAPHQTTPEAVHSFEIVVTHPVGLHARPAAKFVQLANSFPCNITIKNLSDSKPPINAKSVISVLGLGVSQGQSIRVQAEGEKAEEALAALKNLVETNFGEA